MQSFLQKVQDVTGWSDPTIAELLGVSRPAVQAWRTGRNPEYISGRQRKALLDAFRLELAQMEQGLIELEMLA